MSSQILNPAPLVGVSGADNTFLVPAVTHRSAVSEDHTGYNHKDPVELFDRDCLLQEVTISSVDGLTTNLLGNMDPFKLYYNNILVNKNLSAFQFSSFGLIITARMIVPGSCYGVYNLQALCDGGPPQSLPEFDGSNVDAYPNSTQDMHGFMNVELKNNVVMELPWEHYENGVPVSGAADIRCWRLLVWALSPLQSTITPTATGVIQIYARMSKDRSFVNLNYQMKSGKKDPHPTKPSEYMGAASKGVSFLGGMFPSISQYALPAAAGLATLSSMADAFGFTRESAPQDPIRTAKRLGSSVANVDGVDGGEICALTVSNTLSIDPSPGGGESIDPMSYASLFERWTIVDLFTITDDSTGLVRRSAVTPYISNTTTSLYGVVPAWYPTTGGFVGLPFGSWRGGMEYLIYIPSSSNLQGSLQVLWDPEPFSTGVYATDPTNYLTNVVIDLKGTTKTHLSVGYSQRLPVRQSCFYPPNTVGAHSNGVLVFRINSKLIGPKPDPISIQVIVMARPQQDMIFGDPSGSYLVHNGTFETNVGLDYFQYQSDDKDEEETHMIELAPNNAYPTTTLHFGEEIKSVRALVQKFDTIGSLSTPLVVLPHFYPYPSLMRQYTTVTGVSTASARIQPSFTYYAYYLAAFTGVRGSARYKFLLIDDAGANEGSMVEMHANSVGNQASGLAAGFHLVDGLLVPPTQVCDVQYLNFDNGVEFTIPSRNLVKYINPRAHVNPATPSFYARLDTVSFMTAKPAVMMYAGGPDVTVTRFRRVPTMLLSL